MRFRTLPRADWNGVLCLTGSVLAFGSVPLFLRHFSSHLDAWTVNGVRYATAALIWLPVILSPAAQGSQLATCMASRGAPGCAFHVDARLCPCRRVGDAVILQERPLDRNVGHRGGRAADRGPRHAMDDGYEFLAEGNHRVVVAYGRKRAGTTWGVRYAGRMDHR